MGEFFRGWQRKTGLATLIVAMSFVGLWGGSQGFERRVNWNGDRDTYNEIALIREGIRFRKIYSGIFNSGRAIVVSNDLRNIVVPYWHVITPLTLLSAFLLLLKPRIARTKNRELQERSVRGTSRMKPGFDASEVLWVMSRRPKRESDMAIRNPSSSRVKKREALHLSGQTIDYPRLYTV